MENYSLLIIGAAALMKMVVVSMEEPSGGTSRPAACRNRDSCPPDLGFAMTAALEGFSYRGFSIVDSTVGCDRLSFLDAYSGYNQIKLKKEDQELTAFITPHGVFCYNFMTFGLKNAGATYQRCMQACLGEQIGRNIEVYIDDIVAKTKHAADDA
ncbi:hypothetical protein QYE76_059912 [Lolium multiflorum]|uniref:Reverse transcriptase domain-containing protein n=1 Tax=Lolium multiflorum TaxID=4521 RepID=A0AAD8W5Y3_LOLMU|nr:hypothetical protein QYE76_059912 [Lolium multiflorum]